MTDNSADSNITFNEFRYLPNQVEKTAPRFPYEFTPKVLANWIQDMAEIKSMPPDYIAVGLITSLATLIARPTLLHNPSPNIFFDFKIIFPLSSL